MALAVMTAACLGLISCASDSYHAYQAGEGYSEDRTSDTSWRVSFIGSTIESQEAVEAHLLRRAAELTLQSGYQWFVAGVQNAPPSDDSVVVVGERPQTAAPEPVWRPHWRRRTGVRWTDWDPQGPPRTDPQSATPPREQRFFATADIQMGNGPAPAPSFDPHAILNAAATE